MNNQTIETKAQNKAERLVELLLPHLSKMKARFLSSERQFVHYTTGESAVGIIKSERFWLRSTVCMNDVSEVQHGHNAMLDAFNANDGALREKFIKTLEPIYPGLAVEAIKRFDDYFGVNKYRVFVGCFSEHDPKAHKLGRLSMWRAYGKGQTPVALVLDRAGLFTESDSANIFMSPVAYLANEEITSLFSEITTNISENTEFIRSLGADAVSRAIFTMFIFIAVCVKHPGFAEEQEWRLIYLPHLYRSPIVESDVETINGVPQHVFKIPLRNRPDHRLFGIELRDILQSIIVGPTQFPFPVAEAFIDLLVQKGVANPNAKVYAASIPLRT